MKKYLVSAIAVIVLGIIIAAVVWFSGGIYAVWHNPNPQPGNIFSGDITVEKIKNKPGSSHLWATVISDTERHALACYPTETEKNVYLCIPFLKSPNPVTADSTLEDITIEASMMPFYLRIVSHDYMVYHTLDMEMAPVNAQCLNFGDKNCNYIKYPLYQRWGL